MSTTPDASETRSSVSWSFASSFLLGTAVAAFSLDYLALSLVVSLQ